jgi:hypothetical protein
VHFITNLLNAITTPIRAFYMWFARAVPGLKGLTRVALPTRVALTTFLFLFVVYVAAVISIWFSETAAPKDTWEYIVAFALVIIIPFIVYYLIKLWMIKEVSRYPEIDRIWEMGLKECEKNGILPTRVPIFLVQGGRDHRQAVQLMNATHIAFSVVVPSQEESDIGFFANSQAIFLFVNGCSCISALSSAPSGPPAMGPAAAAPVSGGAPPGGTIDAAMFGSGFKLPPATAPGVSKTLTQGAAFPANESGPAMQPAPLAAGGTMLLPGGQGYEAFTQTQGAAKPVPQLNSNVALEREQKLRYVCSLLRKARQTLCPINGLITLLPFELVESASSQIQTAAQKDLAVLREELLVRCSNTVLITQLEDEEGFQELIKRVGEERTREYRFGKGCELWNAPEEKRLDAIAVHATGAFEDWIYNLFQEEHALRQRYNSRLFMLLCRIRGEFAGNLRAVLARGFGFDPQTQPQLAYEQFLFGGCYFCAAGADPGRQAFVKSVFLKGIEQEGELEWAPEARRRDKQLQFMANLFALVGVLSLLAVVGMLIMRFGLGPWE